MRFAKPSLLSRLAWWERSPCAQVVFNISSESVHDQAVHPGVKASALPLLLFGQLQMELQTEPTSSGCGVAEGAVASLLNRWQ